ncbi:hypothetical protein B0H13DRAFT_2311764 [Mycena leptocephala]|nr:hypothetical protein B0H13DRAFT_2311764 [Mycena leptocephala]
MSTAASRRLSDELWRRILINCPYSNLATFGLISKQYSTFSDRILYHKVHLSFPRALLFFRTLRGRPALGANVRYLYLQNAQFCHDGAAFEASLASLTHLRDLHILCPVDVHALVTCLRAPLHSFTYGFPVCQTIHRFLVQQRTITAISLHHPVHQDPTPTFLPALETVEALSEDLADLIVGARVRHITFRYRPEERVTQPVLVDQEQLDVHLPDLETLVVLQDVTWGIAEPQWNFLSWPLV